MSEMEFKEKLSTAMAEPAVPPKLVDDTVKRVQTLLKGREAEKRLAAEETLSAKEKTSLAADGILGQLAGSGKLPLGADTVALKQQLLQNERFAQLMRQSPRSIAGGLESGELMKSMTQKPVKTAPPVKRPPTLGK